MSLGMTSTVFASGASPSTAKETGIEVARPSNSAMWLFWSGERCWDDDEAGAHVRGQGVEDARQRFEAASGGADADDGSGEPSRGDERFGLPVVGFGHGAENASSRQC